LTSIFDLENYGDNVAVSLPDHDISYLQLATRADSLGGELRAGDLVAVECNNGIGCLTAYLSAQRKRLPVLLVDAALVPELRKSLYGRYRVSIVFDAVRGSWARHHSSAPELHPDLALLLSTSGSTGSPKLVRLSHGNLACNARAIANYLHLTSAERPITALPLQYAYGLSVVNSHLATGAALVLTDLTMAERSFWERMTGGRVTSFAGVPMMYEMLRRLRVDRMDLPCLKTLTQAGGRLAPASVEWMAKLSQERGWRFFVMYGQTEATARMAYLPPQLVASHPSSIGLPIPGGRFEIEDDSGNIIVENGRVGQLIYYGDNVMMGYAEGPDDLSLGDEYRGRLPTGDLAEGGPEGLYYIRGRRARFVKIFGNRLGLDEVEAMLEQRGYAVVVTGRDDRLVLAALELDVLEQARTLVGSLYRIHLSAIAIVRLDEIPRSASGKVSYTDVLAMSEQFRSLN
jgi:acyl-coenzyme A synthetase/AMP-(fatty) acid ligase